MFDTNSGGSMTNVTITDNRTSTNNTINGSGLWCDGGGNVTVKNSISWNNNTGAEVFLGTGSFTITFSDVRGGWTGVGNINTNPVFVSTVNFHLQGTSPCLNTGTLPGSPNDDLDFLSRPMPLLSNPDMGAYELNQPLSINPFLDNELYCTISPNPSSGIFTIQAEEEIKGVEVYNVMGEKVYLTPSPSPKGEGSVVDLSAQPKGIYFYRVVTANGVGSGKVVVE